MARTFNGSTDKLLVSTGATPTAGGAFTWVAVVRQSVTTFGNQHVAVLDHGGGSASGLRISSGAFDLIFANNIYDPTSTLSMTLNATYLIAVSKASGFNKPRFHLYAYSTDTWGRSDGTTNTTGSASSVAGLYLGCRSDSAAFYSGDIAAVAFYSSQLSDSQLDSMPYSLGAWRSLAPATLLVLDQQLTTQTVTDLMGRGASQTSLTGTSVSANSVPILGYGHPVLMATHAAAGGATQDGAAALSAASSLAAAGSATSAAAVAMTAASGVTAAGITTRPGAVAMSAASSLTAAGDVTAVGAVAMSAASSLTAGTVSTGGTPPVFRVGAQAFGTASSAALTIPGTVQVDDQMLMSVAFKLLTSTGTIATPSGWAQVEAPLTGPGSNALQGAVFAKTAVSGDIGSTVTLTGSGGTQQLSVAFAAYSGATATFRSISWVAGSATSSTTVTAPATVDSPQSSDLVVVLGVARETVNGPASNPTFTGSGGVTIRSQIAGTSGSSQNVGAFIGDDTSTASGDRTITASVTSLSVAGLLILQSSTTSTTYQGSATLSAASGLSAGAVATGVAGATLSAASGLTALGARIQPATVTLSADTSLAAAGDVAAVGSAALTAASGMTVAAARVQLGTAPLSAASGLTAGATGIYQAGATLSAASGLTSIGVAIGAATVTLSATSGLSAAGTATGFGAVALSAASGLTAGALRTVNPAVALSAASSLTAAATATGVSTVAMSAASSLVAAAVRTAVGASAPLSAATGLTAAGSTSTGSGATLSAASGLSAAGVRTAPAVVAMSAASSLVAAAVRTAVGASAPLSAATDLTAISGNIVPGAVAMSAASNLTAAAVRQGAGVAALSAGTDLTAAVVRTAASAAALSAAGSLTAGGSLQQGSAAALSAGTSMTGSVRYEAASLVDLVAAAHLVVAGAVGMAAGADLSAAGGLTAGVSGGSGATVSMRAQTTLLVAGQRSASGMAVLDAQTTLSIDALHGLAADVVLSASTGLNASAITDALPVFAAAHGVTIRRPIGSITRTDPVISTLRRSI